MATIEDVMKKITITNYNVWPLTEITTAEGLENALENKRKGGSFFLGLIQDPAGGENNFWLITCRYADDP
jgi:hypothetical protein